jgi:hypothetical protein
VTGNAIDGAEQPRRLTAGFRSIAERNLIGDGTGKEATPENAAGYAARQEAVGGVAIGLRQRCERAK